MNLKTIGSGILFITTLLLMSCGHQNYKTKQVSLDQILKSPHRSKNNKARDRFRHPKETLEFFEVKPDMKVIEISPGRGWYTEILGPYLKDSGTLRLTLFSDTSKKSYRKKLNKATRSLIQNEKLFGKVELATLEAPNHIGPIAPEGSFDRILTFRNVHSWQKTGHGLKAFKIFHAALKKGGILGVVQHRAPESSNVSTQPKKGYMKESQVIALAEKAGFKLLEKSEINANPKDTADYKGGVWTLLPSLNVKDEKKKEQYRAIGESDRMTLKFVKM